MCVGLPKAWEHTPVGGLETVILWFRCLWQQDVFVFVHVSAAS